MTSEEIRQMFRDAADLGRMGPFDENRKPTEERYASLAARYRDEYLRAKPERRTETPKTPEWKAALAYVANVLRQMDVLAPESAEMNRAAWAMIAPAVQKHYEGEKTGKNEEPAE